METYENVLHKVLASVGGDTVVAHLIQVLLLHPLDRFGLGRSVVHRLALLERRDEALVPDERVVSVSAVPIFFLRTIAIEITSTQPVVSSISVRVASSHVGQRARACRVEHDNVLEVVQARVVDSNGVPHIAWVQRRSAADEHSPLDDDGVRVLVLLKLAEQLALLENAQLIVDAWYELKQRNSTTYQ
jgi:hypothetical protein